MSGKCRQIKHSIFADSSKFNEKTENITETFEGNC